MCKINIKYFWPIDRQLNGVFIIIFFIKKTIIQFFILLKTEFKLLHSK